MNVYTGKRSPVSAAPVRNARFTTDGDGNARFARGSGSDNFSKLYYRDPSNKPWRLINDEAISERIETVLGLSADGRTVYLTTEAKTGPDAIVAMEIASGSRTELLRDPIVDPDAILSASDSDAPVGASYMHDRSSTRFFDPA